MLNKFLILLSYGVGSFLTQTILLQQPLAEEVVSNAAHTGGSIFSFFDVASPLVSLFGCGIYSLILKIRHTDALAQGVMVKPWTKHHTELSIYRLVLAVMLGAVSGTFLNMVGTYQTFFRAGLLPQEGVNGAAALAIGFFIMKITKKEFEDELWDLTKDKVLRNGRTN